MITSAEAVLVFAALSAGALAAQERPPDRWIGKVSFDGNESLGDLTLQAGISTGSSSWTFRSFLRLGDRNRWDEVEFRRDVVRLQLLYRQHGYYEARVDTAVDRRDHLFDVTFRIVEGPPVLVDSVTVTGVDSVRDGAGLAGGIPLKRGKPFDRFLFEASADSIAFAMRNRGYPWATVFRNYTVDRRARRASASFDVLTGPRARIGEIRIEGMQRVRERTVRRALVVRDSDLYRQEALFESQRSLYQGELFRYASIGIASPDSMVGGVDSLVRLRVQVAEATPLQMRVGLGYGTLDCLRASGTLTKLNFLGEARRFDVVGRVSKIGVGAPTDFGLENSICRQLANDPYSEQINYLGSLTLTQPTTLLRRSTVSVSGFAERRSEFNAYLFQSIGVALGFKFGFGRRSVPISLNYRLSRDQTTANPANYCIYFDQCDPAALAPFLEPLRQGTLTLSIVNRRTDSPIDPTRGQVLSLEASTARPGLGSEVVFDRLVLEAVNYAPWKQRVFSARLRGGILRQGLSTIGGSLYRYVPPPDRFYAGGPTTVRGYARNEMGPLVYVADSLVKDSTGATIGYVGLRSSPVGSSAIVLANVELRLPTPLFSGRVSVSAFIDGGELWEFVERDDSSTTYVPGGFRVTPGVGLQVSTPLGPMRLDAAYNGYTSQPGRLYDIDTATGDLDEVPGGYAGKPRGATFLSRIQWHFSVGLAF